MHRKNVIVSDSSANLWNKSIYSFTGTKLRCPSAYLSFICIKFFSNILWFHSLSEQLYRV